jgi:hypothetical protein
MHDLACCGNCVEYHPQHGCTHSDGGAMVTIHFGVCDYWVGDGLTAEGRDKERSEYMRARRVLDTAPDP